MLFTGRIESHYWFEQDRKWKLLQKRDYVILQRLEPAVFQVVVLKIAQINDVMLVARYTCTLKDGV